MDSDKPLRERDPLVGARVAQTIIDGLDAMAARLRAENPNERNNRSVAIRTCFEIADVVLRGDRLAALRALATRNGTTLAGAVDAVMETGLSVVARRT